MREKSSSLLLHGEAIVTRQPNERLQALIQEAGCSHAGLARRVNLCGAEQGCDVRYDKTSVARRLRGQQPRGRAPKIVAEALGRTPGRVVTLDEIGMAAGLCRLRSERGAEYLDVPAPAGAVRERAGRARVRRASAVRDARLREGMRASGRSRGGLRRSGPMCRPARGVLRTRAWSAL